MSGAAAEPIQDVSHLAHVELRTPRLNETLAFLTSVFGLRESARAGPSVYLRAWGDFYHHTLKITDAAQPGRGGRGGQPAIPRGLPGVQAARADRAQRTRDGRVAERDPPRARYRLYA